MSLMKVEVFFLEKKWSSLEVDFAGFSNGAQEKSQNKEKNRVKYQKKKVLSK